MNSDLLRNQRKQLGWTQAKVAEALGINIKTVRRWELGLSVPYPYYRRRLSILFGKTAQQLGLMELKGLEEEFAQLDREEEEIALQSLSPASKQTPFLADPTILGILDSPNSLPGRSGLLMQVKKRLFAEGDLPFMALHGLPGVGKTALAVALATDRQARTYFPDGILWATLGKHPKVLSQLASWGKLLGVVPSQVKDTKSRQGWGRALRDAIGSRRFLLVIDDAWTAEDARAFQVGSPQCSYLLTTSLSQVAFAFGPERAIAVPELKEVDGLALLAHFVPQLVDEDPQGVQALVRAVGCLPLALTLMGNSLALLTFSEHPWPLRVALAQLRQTQEYLRLTMTTAWQHWPSLAETVPLSLYATIAMCDQWLSPQAHAALRALTIFPPKSYSFSKETALAVSDQPGEALDELWEAGLLESWGPGRYTLQQTVADYAMPKPSLNDPMTIGQPLIEGSRHMNENFYDKSFFAHKSATLVILQKEERECI